MGSAMPSGSIYYRKGTFRGVLRRFEQPGRCEGIAENPIVSLTFRGKLKSGPVAFEDLGRHQPCKHSQMAIDLPVLAFLREDGIGGRARDPFREEPACPGSPNAARRPSKVRPLTCPGVTARSRRSNEPASRSRRSPGPQGRGHGGQFRRPTRVLPRDRCPHERTTRLPRDGRAIRPPARLVQRGPSVVGTAPPDVRHRERSHAAVEGVAGCDWFGFGSTWGANR